VGHPAFGELGKGEGMNPPNYSITCNCGITIGGNNEKGLVELVKLHNENGRWHLMWKNYFNIVQKTEYEERIERENSANTTG
jgi:hypothetical protein